MNKLTILIAGCIFSIGAWWIYVSHRAYIDELSEVYEELCQAPKFNKDRMYCGWVKFMISE